MSSHHDKFAGQKNLAKCLTSFKMGFTSPTSLLVFCFYASSLGRLAGGFTPLEARTMTANVLISSGVEFTSSVPSKQIPELSWSCTFPSPLLKLLPGLRRLTVSLLLQANSA